MKYATKISITSQIEYKIKCICNVLLINNYYMQFLLVVFNYKPLFWLYCILYQLFVFKNRKSSQCSLKHVFVLPILSDLIRFNVIQDYKPFTTAVNINK